MEMAEHYKLEEVDKVDPRGAGGESAPVFEWQFENKDTVVVNDEPLTMDSSIGFLRAAAEHLGVSKNGNKEMIWTRLNQKVQTLEHEQLFLDSNRLHKDVTVETRSWGTINFQDTFRRGGIARVVASALL